jgi:serine/threonine-protein phosphatase 2B catalytic subunit
VPETDDRFDEFMSVEWKPNYERGCSFYFGYRAVRRFLDDNNLLCIVRAHQVCNQHELFMMS